MKKLISIVLALAMIMMVGAVYADDPVNNRTADTTISITNLDEGDTVALYKIIEWDGYWKPANGYAGLSQTEVDGIVGQNHETGLKIDDAAGWTDEYINKVITSTLPTAVSLGDAATIGSSKTFEYTATPGMYYVVVTPKDGKKIYKPMFVSADYSSTNTTTTVAAKFETITIDKHATGQTNNQDPSANYNETNTEANSFNTVGIGDTVSFEINTQIPVFPVSFEHPIFNVSDTLNGLTLKHGEGDIKVYAGNTLLTLGEQYTLDPAATDGGFTVKFAEAYIKNVKTAAQAIKIEYQGVVNNAAEYDVNAKENTATVKFSNNPDDTVGANELKDETRHYTFSINGKVLYEGDRHGTDLIKVGIDANGNEITDTIQLPNEHFAGALEGATFTLYAENKTTVIRENLSSSATGQIEINGLDAGTYYLRETAAPAGYIKSNTDAKIEIIPTFNKKVVPAETKNVTIGNKTVQITVPSYSYAELASYTIKINDVTTSTYTVTNDMISGIDDDQIGTGSTAGNPGTDSTGKIKNPKGTELPSTGGIGTTIFYILGGLLVIGAAVILVARRKAQD